MKRIFASLITLVLFAAMAMAQADASKAASSSQSAETSRDITNIEHELESLGNNKDRGKLSALAAESMTNGWMGVGPNGMTLTKSQMLAYIREGDLTPKHHLTEMKVHSYENAAVAFGSHARKDEKDLWRDYFVKQNGQWKMVFSAMTKISNPAPTQK